MKEDKRNKFDEEIFTYSKIKGSKVFIFWNDKQVMILKDKKAENFLSRVSNANPMEAQLIMAKLTGNFKRGNERN